MIETNRMQPTFNHEMHQEQCKHVFPVTFIIIDQEKKVYFL